jgi:hypothetical protein
LAIFQVQMPKAMAVLRERHYGTIRQLRGAADIE